MVVKRVKKQTYKQCVVVLICLLIVGNLAQGVVLCFGSDGHVEFESAFHERCDGHAHSQSTDQKQLSYQSDHGENSHCEPCIDVPITIGLAKITNVFEQLNSTLHVPAVKTIVLDGRFNNSAYSSGSNVLDAVSYFSPLRTVILLI